MVNWMNNLKKGVKILLAFPLLDGLFWGIYRIVDGFQKRDPVQIVGGILWVLLGATIFWVVDIVSISMRNKITVLV